MSGFSYPPAIFKSSVYNPAFYLSLDSTGYLTYDYAQTLYLSKNDFRLTYITGITPGVVQSGTALVLDNSLSLTGLGSISCSSLTVAGSPVATAPDYVLSITPGTASASKALVLDADLNISGITSIDISGHDGSTTGLSLGGVLITAAASELNYVDTIAGTAQASKALVLDADRIISNINQISANVFNGIGGGTSFKCVDTASGGRATMEFTNNMRSLEIGLRGSSASGPQNAFYLYGGGYNFVIESSGNATIGSWASSSGYKLNVLGSLNATSYYLNGVPIDFSESPYLSGITAGTAEASKALVVNADKDITGIRNLTAVNLTGTLQTASQSQITSIGTQVSLNALEYRLNGSLIDFDSFTAESPYLSDVIAGSAVASKALVVNSSRDISGINQISSNVSIASLFKCSNIDTAGRSTIDFNNDLRTLELGLRGSTMDQPDTFYIYSSGAYHLVIESNGNCSIGGTSSGGYKLNIAGSTNTTSLSIDGTLITSTAAKLNYTDITTIGTAQASKALVVDANRDISNLNSLTALNLTGTLQTATQPQITSVGTLTSLSVSGSISGTLQTAAQPQITSVGTLTSLSVSGSISGTLSTAAQPSITSLGTLSSLSVSGAISASQLTGTLQTPAQPLITSVGTLTSLSITGALNATLATSAQPSITSIGTLSGLTTHALTLGNGTINELRFAGVSGDGTNDMCVIAQRLYGVSDFSEMILFSGNDGEGASGPDRIRYRSGEHRFQTFIGDQTYSSIQDDNNRLIIANNGDVSITKKLTVSGEGINAASISLNGVLITSTATKLNYVDITTIGTAEASKALVVDANRDISNINSITATSIAGTLQTAAQPTITSLGTLSSLSTGNITLNGSLITSTATELNYLDITTVGSAEASKALVLNASKNIDSINSLTSTILVASTTLTVNGIDVASNISPLVGATPGSAVASKALILNSDGVIRFPSGSRTTNCIQFYNGTDFKETLSIYRENDDSGLTIAMTPITPQKSTPILRLLSGDGLNSGTHPSKIIEIIRSEIINTRLSGLDIYTSGLWTIYDYGTTPPWKSSGFADYTQIYSSQPALNIACNTSDTTTYASSNNLLLTDQGQVCINTATPNGNYQLTVNKSATKAGISVNGNATILKLQNSGGSTSDRTSFEMTHNTTWECSLGGSGHSTAPNSLYWYNGGYRMCLTPSGRLGINTASPFCPLVVNGFSSLTITDIGTSTMAYNISNNTWTNLGGGPVSYNISAYFSSAIHVQNTIYCSSDRRLKENIQPLEITEEHYQKLMPKSYSYKNDDKTKLGLIAQDVLGICREAVMMNPNEKLEIEQEGDIQGVQLNIDYQSILMMSVAIIKKLIDRMDKLEKKNRPNIR